VAQQAAAVIPAEQSATLAVMSAVPEHLPAAQMEKAKAIAAAFDIEKPQSIIDFGSAGGRRASATSGRAARQRSREGHRIRRGTS